MSDSVVESTAEIAAPSAACESCSAYRAAKLKKLGIAVSRFDYVVALAGNPNTGKSTVFNALTGLRQHTGNWPGKTVARAEGAFEYAEKRFKLVDLPGTYSLLSTSLDEQIARDFVLFGEPDVTVIVVDATRLERNLNLALQVIEITDRAVICLNLLDEARRHGISVDERHLSRELGVPVIPCSARFGTGLPELLQAVADVATGKIICKPKRLKSEPPALKESLADLMGRLKECLPELPNPRWVALRLLGGDDSVSAALRNGDFGAASVSAAPAVLSTAHKLRQEIPGDLHEHMVEAIYRHATEIAGSSVSRFGTPGKETLDRRIDRLVTSRLWGFPIMILLFALIFWITISGANVPSGMLASLLVDTIHPWLRGIAVSLGSPWWLTGVLVDGMYLATAWVVSVMLPPMAIFFPLFTLLEDAGYLPRVAFNLDRLFQKAGAHGKQAMTTMMGFGCNAAGVISTRIIDSPRERLLAIVTNNFALCNGRWPTQFLMAAVFIGGLAPAHFAGLISAAAVTGVAMLGVGLTLVMGWVLSRTVLKGELSTFSLELPPYRPPRVLQTLYTSLLDRTLFVLWRAVVFALPAGALIWLSANVHIGGQSFAQHFVSSVDPVALIFGLNGVILLAYLIAVPANEIVIPTILMLTVTVAGVQGMGEGAGVMFELDSKAALEELLRNSGWTLLTAVNLMLFSLLHNPCSTTIYTIYKETGSVRWTAIATFMPLVIGLAVTFLVAVVWRAWAP
jgi:ferrous iron transport protein B